MDLQLGKKNYNVEIRLNIRSVGKPKGGSSKFLFDNWTGLGPLYFITPTDFKCTEDIQIVNEFEQEGR